MRKLYRHQQRFIDKNPDRALLLWEGGLGKSLAAIRWLGLREERRGLVVCPKSIVGKWRRDLELEGVKATVMSRDDIKKYDLSSYSALVLDEAQDFSSPLFTKQRSARAMRIYNHIKEHPDTHVLLLTATPVRSTPWNIHTLACYLKIVWPVKAFRDKFFYFTDMFGRYHYELRDNWRTEVRPYIEQIADIVLMHDVVDVPLQHHQVIDIAWTKEQEKALSSQYLEPAAEWHERHRAENGPEKLKVVKELASKYRKVILVCHYTQQIVDYGLELVKERQVFALSGATKDQDAVIEAAKAADDCIFIVQASMGAGFDADEFSVVIFASMSFKYVDYAQMKFRVKRIHNLHENTFIHLLGGKNDRAVYETIEKGKDFDVLEYLRKA